MAHGVGEGPPVRVRWLIAVGCMLSVLLAQQGLQSLWDVAAYTSPISEFWFTQALPVGMAGCLLAATLLPSSVSRWLRMAVLLPIVHVVAIAVVGKIWVVLEQAMAARDNWAFYSARPPLPSLTTLIVLALTPIVIGLLVEHRRGEWAHASVMFALAFLLLLGLWFPVVCWDWYHRSWNAEATVINFSENWAYSYTLIDRHLDIGKLLLIVLLPPVALASCYTWLSFHRRALIGRYRGGIQIATRILFGAAALATLTMRDDNAVLYLAFTYLLLLAVILAAVSLVTLTAISWLRSLVVARRMAAMTQVAGTVVADDGDAVATLGVTSWLRGPRIDMQPFAVSTTAGDVFVRSAELMTAIARNTTSLELGGEAPVLAPGDRVVLGIAKHDADGHPFRASELGDVLMVATPGAGRYRFSDVALVVWRPAVAYLAILAAVAVPPVLMILS